jgi:septation ring formation regulator EzrA
MSILAKILMSLFIALLSIVLISPFVILLYEKRLKEDIKRLEEKKCQ